MYYMITLPITYKRTTYQVLIDDEDLPTIQNYKWHITRMNNVYYAYADTYEHGKYHMLYMHRLIIHAPNTRKLVTDHINGNGLDNRKNNLRLVTNGQNFHNSRLSSLNTSGYKGVHWNKRIKMYKAQIDVDGKHIYLGCYASAKYAAAVYDSSAVYYFGECARINGIMTG